MGREVAGRRRSILPILPNLLPMLIRADKGAARPMGGADARQSKAMPLLEAVTNVVVGFVLAFSTQVLAFPLFGLQVSVTDNILISLIFTVVSIVRASC
jgi:hypothetical protein